VIGEVECIQQHRGEPAGVAPDDGEMQVRFHSSIRCKTEELENVRRSAGMEEESWEGEGSAGFVVGAKLVRRRLQTCGATARDCAVLAAARSEKQKGRGRGVSGIYRGGHGVAIEVSRVRDRGRDQDDGFQ
jgi:hypothetical protein